MSGIEKRVNICISKIRQRVAGVAREKVEGLSDRIVVIETQSRRSRLATWQRATDCKDAGFRGLYGCEARCWDLEKSSVMEPAGNAGK